LIHPPSLYRATEDKEEGENMRKSILLVFAMGVSLLFNLTYGDEFAAIVTKPFPGQPVQKLFKMVAEIPEFKKVAAEDKTEWDSFAKQVNDITRMEIKAVEEINNNPVVQKFEKFKETSFAKRKELAQAVDNFIDNFGGSKVKQLKSEMEVAKKEIEVAEQKLKTFSKESVEPLEKKQKELIKQAYKKEYGSENAWLKMTLRQTRAFEEAKVKNTEAYLALDKKLKPLKEQEKLLRKEWSDLFKKWMALADSLDKIKDEAKKSKDFPENLKKLDAEVAELQKQHSELFKEAWAVREKIKKVDFGKVWELGMKLRELFNKMTKK